MSGVLGVVKISDVPEIKADTYSGNATIGEVTQKEVNNGKVQISIPFEYQRANGTDAKFTARVFVHPDWFEEGYVVLNPNNFDQGTPERSEGFAYQLNVSKVLRPIAKFAGLDSIDLEQFEGKTVGIQLGPEGDKGDPSRQQLKRVFAATVAK